MSTNGTTTEEGTSRTGRFCKVQKRTKDAINEVFALGLEEELSRSSKVSIGILRSVKESPFGEKPWTVNECAVAVAVLGRWYKAGKITTNAESEDTKRVLSVEEMERLEEAIDNAGGQKYLTAMIRDVTGEAISESSIRKALRRDSSTQRVTTEKIRSYFRALDERAASRVASVALVPEHVAPSALALHAAPSTLHFSRGDMVTFISGGPIMTVDASDVNFTRCFWFDLSKSLNCQDFPTTFLIPAKKDES